MHRLHGRDRRGRPPSRRRPRRRPRRARADAEPAPRRDGRVRAEGQHHPDRGHEPARHPRPRAAAPRPLRPADRRRPARPHRPQEDPRGAREGQAAGRGDRARHARGRHARLHRRRPREPRQRGSAARGAPRQEDDRPGRARGRDHARDRRPREEDAPLLRAGAKDHRVPRDGPCARRPLHRPGRRGPQDLDHQPRPGARLHDLAAARGPLPDDAHGLDGPARGHPRRPCCGGAGLRRDHDRRGERPREGHAHGEADDHALRDEREARPARARPEPGHAVPGSRDGLRAGLLRGDRPRDRQRDQQGDRARAHEGAQGARGAPGGAAPPVGDPRRARDDRQGSVHQAPRGRARGRGVPGGGVRDSRAGEAEGRRAPQAPAEAEAVPAARAGHAAADPEGAQS